jgi:type IV secretory pathway VirB2 component (pilin)
MPPDRQPSPSLRWLPYLFAAGAIFWLVELTQAAAMVAAPVGRDQLYQALVKAGITGNTTPVLVLYMTIVLGIEATAAALHATAYYGLKRRRAWGWIAAVIVAGAWSLVLMGIPVFVFLLQRRTRQAYGIS